MRRIIIFLAIIGFIFVMFYPPVISSGQSESRVDDIVITEHVIEMKEDVNDKKIAQLYSNIHVIDSLDKQIKKQKAKPVLNKKKPVKVEPEKKRNLWQKMTGFLRK